MDASAIAFVRCTAGHLPCYLPYLNASVLRKVGIRPGRGNAMATRSNVPPGHPWLPELLVLGHVTCDNLVGGTTSRLGGAAAFAARAAAHLGVRTAVVTAAPKTFTLLAPLRD